MKLKFPVAANQRQYEAMHPKWTRCRHATAGSDAVKEQGSTYLPMLAAHLDPRNGAAKYEAYKKRALFYNATKRTKLGLSGAATAKSPKIVTTGQKAADYAEIVLRQLRDPIIGEQLETSFCAVVVNQPSTSKIPTPTVWPAENVVNWRIDQVNEERLLTLLVLE